MKRLYFFQCQEDYNRSMYLPYSSGILWAYVKQFKDITDNYELVDIYFEKIGIHEYLDKLVDPDVVLFSNYGWNTTYHLGIAELVKQRWPNCVTVIGGPNAQQEESYLCEHPYVDISVWGEGENTLLELLRNLNDDLSKVSGIAYIKNKIYNKTSTRTRSPDLGLVPSPYLEGIFDSYFDRYDYNFMPVWETNRGCPYHCTFCDLGADYYNKLFIFTTERLMAEVDWFVKKKIEYVEIADANFGILERDLELVKHIKKCHDETGYPQKVNATWAKNSPDRVLEMSLILEGINRGGVTLALQSSNKLALDNIKRINIVNDRLETIANRYIENNVQTYHDFILGLPGETVDSWQQGLLQIVDINPEGWIFGHPLEAYRNTEFSDPAYIEKHKLKFATTPQVTFYANRKTDVPLELGRYVVETFSMNRDQYIESFLFKWFLITVHSLGWAAYSAEKSGVARSVFYNALYKWMLTTPGLLQDQYNKTKECLTNTLDNGTFWGRQMFGKDDVWWEYESASCIEFEQHRDQYFLELAKFLNKEYPNLNGSEIADANNKDIVRFNSTDFRQFCIKIWWHGRRRKAWKSNDES
jgi:radical SAM superfamily enzyme YgiQ (UPF0313 family)